MGGEAIKASQYLEVLRSEGKNAFLITHGRCRKVMKDSPHYKVIYFLDDDILMLLIWKTRIFRSLLNAYFHILVKRLIKKKFPDHQNTILHYLCPISPVELRFPVKGYYSVLGPISGNIFYPPAFKARQSKSDNLKEKIYLKTSNLINLLFGEKKKFKKILISGSLETMETLEICKLRKEDTLMVVDSGISQSFLDNDRIAHVGSNGRFVCMARLINLKGVDLAIKALMQTDKSIKLDIFGEGSMRDEWEALTRKLGVEDRVRFLGWLNHDRIHSAFRNYRGFVFPTLAESNGIVMQEAMILGLPVITLNWAGPGNLADDQSAIYIEPVSEEHVVAEIASAMNKLASDDAFANKVAHHARAIAELNFVWPSVSQSWQQAYPEG